MDSADIAMAYESTAYSSYREQVSGMLISIPTKVAAEYRWPLPLPSDGADELAGLRAAARERALTRKIQDDMLTPLQRQTAERIKKIAEKSKPKDSQDPVSPKPARRTAKLSAKEFLQTEVRRRGGAVYPQAK